MRTSVEIHDSLLNEARRVAAKEGRTLRALVEEGLRKVLAERKKSAAFRLRRASFKGQGLQEDVAGVSWERIRELTYEGRGT